MRNSDFLAKLKREGKLEIVEPSEQIADSYARKGVECREVAILALDHGYFESAVTQSYYSMYDHVLSLLAFCGIKCENHSAVAIILREMFDQQELYTLFSKAKEERIDKQYYVTSPKADPASKESAKEAVSVAMSFNPRILALKKNLSLEEIKRFRMRVNDL